MFDKWAINCVSGWEEKKMGAGDLRASRAQGSPRSCLEFLSNANHKLPQILKCFDPASFNSQIKNTILSHRENLGTLWRNQQLPLSWLVPALTVFYVMNVTTGKFCDHMKRPKSKQCAKIPKSAFYILWLEPFLQELDVSLERHFKFQSTYRDTEEQTQKSIPYRRGD